MTLESLYPPVVIMRGNDICFTGVMKSFFRSKIPFKTITFSWKGSDNWFSEKSSIFKRDFTIHNPFSSSEKALNDLIMIGKILKKDFGQRLLLVPTSDTNLIFILDHENYLNKYFILMGDVSHKNYRRDVYDKNSCYELLSKSKLDRYLPKSMRCEGYEDIKKIIAKMTLPLVYKPSIKDYGQTFYSSHSKSKAIFCDEKKILENKLTTEINNKFPLIVQEKIIFDSSEFEVPFYAFCDNKFNIKLAATAKKELIQPYPFGTSNVLRLTWRSELLDIAQDVVKALKWRGLIMIEFIKDKKDNNWKIIEINTRPWLFIDFFSRYSINFLEYVYKDCFVKSSFEEPSVFPSKKILDLNPVHIDINSIFTNMSMIERTDIFDSIDNLNRWLSNFPGQKTSPYYDEFDKNLARSNAKNLFEKLNIPNNFNDFFEFLYNKLTVIN